MKYSELKIQIKTFSIRIHPLFQIYLFMSCYKNITNQESMCRQSKISHDQVKKVEHAATVLIHVFIICIGEKQVL